MFDTVVHTLSLDGSGEAGRLIQSLAAEGWMFSHPLINHELADKKGEYHCVFKRPKQ